MFNANLKFELKMGVRFAKEFPIFYTIYLNAGALCTHIHANAFIRQFDFHFLYLFIETEK